MGDVFSHHRSTGPSKVADRSNVEQAANDEDPNSIYRLVKLKGGGLLVDALRRGHEHGNGADLVADTRRLVRDELSAFLTNGIDGYEVDIDDMVRRRRKQRLSRLNANERESVNASRRCLATRQDRRRRRRVWWSVDRRGAVGETALHLCLLNNGSLYRELAVEIVNVFPCLVNDIYAGDLYYGEAPLHIAIVNGDLEMVKLLLAKGAWVDAAAVGRFFYPTDQEKDRTDDGDGEGVVLPKETNYEGPCYFGEYPLSFAACHNHFQIVRLLMEFSDQTRLHHDTHMKDWIDSNGNNVLHMMVIYGLKDMYRFLFTEFGCSDQCKNKNGFTPLTLAVYLGKKEMFNFILSLKKVPQWTYGRASSALYPLKEIDTIVPGRNEINELSAINLMVNKHTLVHAEMTEGLVYEILSAKWKHYARRIFFQHLLAFGFYVLILTTALILRPAHDPNRSNGNGSLVCNQTRVLANETFTDCNSTNKSNVNVENSCYLRDCSKGSTGIARCVCEAFALLFAVAFLMSRILSGYSLGWKKNGVILMQSPATIMFLLSCFCLVAAVPGRIACVAAYEDVFIVLAVVLAWPRFLFFYRGFKLVGSFVVMISKMCKSDLVRFIVIYAIFLMGFSQGLYVTFIGTNHETFDHPVGSMLGLFHMTLGEFGSHYVDLDKHSKYPALAKFFFVLMMIFMFVVLVNMLIAMMGNTYEAVAETRREWHRQWAQIVLNMERSASLKDISKLQEKYSHRGDSWTGYFAWTSYESMD